MKVYVGQTRASKLIARLAALKIGECTNRGELPPRRSPWFLDNGAFKDWRSGTEWDSDKWLRDVERVRSGEVSPPPVLAVCPDVVAGGLESLEHSRRWLPSLDGIPAYLAVQDGMTEPDVARELGGYAGVFVGGSLPWKLETGGAWVAFAHRHGLPCHIGRVGTARRVRWAYEIGADSIDSCLPLWSEANLQQFLGALRSSRQQLPLFAESDPLP